MHHTCRAHSRLHRRAKKLEVVYGLSAPYLPMPQKVWEELHAQADGLASGEHKRRARFGILIGSRHEEAMYDREIAA
jgi:hypothetical protein